MKQVIYDTLGFLEKNRDLLHSDLLQLLYSCEAPMLQLFATKIEQAGLQKVARPRRRSAQSQKQTVATKFKVCLYSFALFSHNREKDMYKYVRNILINESMEWEQKSCFLEILS
jgi:myosin heavy subunit